ncbi:acyl-CoA dehydrogenase C-terminal domain-containing protein, partial [Pseudomonas aeruginosa]
NNGAGLRQLTRLIQDACRRAEAHPSLAALRQPLERLVARLSEVTLALLGDLMQGQVNQGLANSALYLKVFGHAVNGWASARRQASWIRRVSWRRPAPLFCPTLRPSRSRDWMPWVPSWIG